MSRGVGYLWAELGINSRSSDSEVCALSTSLQSGLLLRLNQILCPFLSYWEKNNSKTVPLSHSLCQLSSDLFPKSGCFVTFPEFHSPGMGGKSVLPQPLCLVSLGNLICIPVSPTFNAPKPEFKAITSLKFMK